MPRDGEISRETVGRNLRRARESRGKSRSVLAGLVGRSEDWLKLIEAGKRGLTLPMAIRVARALGLRDLGDLYGGSLAVPVDFGDKAVHDGAGAVVQAMTAYAPLTREQPVDVAAVKRTLAAAQRTWNEAPNNRTDIATALPVLLGQARTTACGTDAGERRAAYAALAEAYTIAQYYFAWQGDDLSTSVWLAADRCMQAAEQADHPLIRAHSAWGYARVLRATGRAEEAMEMMDACADELEPWLAEDTDDERAMWGMLRLCQAVTIARDCRDPGAWTYWSQADQVAGVLPTGYVHPWSMFGRALVDLYAVHLDVTLGQAGEALRRAERIDTDAIPFRDQAVSYLVQIATAYRQRGDDAALLIMQQAERRSAEGVKFNIAARGLAHELATKGRRTIRADALALAGRLGVEV